MSWKSAGLAVALITAVTVGSTAGGAVAAKQITGRQIKNGSVTGRDIRDGSVTGRDIRDRSVTAADLAPGAAAANLAPGSVTRSQLDPSVRVLPSGSSFLWRVTTTAECPGGSQWEASMTLPGSRQYSICRVP